MKNLFQRIVDKGISDSIFLLFYLLWTKIQSLVRITVFRLRLYDVDYSAEIKSNVIIFQSKKHTIIIDKGTAIGDGVRITSGFEGRIHIGKNVGIHDYSFIVAHNGITIGDGSLIAAHVYICDVNHKYPLSKFNPHIINPDNYESKPIFIGKNVWIGTGAIILPGVSIGNDAVIGAGAVVTKNIPENSVAIGNPARVIRKF